MVANEPTNEEAGPYWPVIEDNVDDDESDDN